MTPEVVEILTRQGVKNIQIRGRVIGLGNALTEFDCTYWKYSKSKNKYDKEDVRDTLQEKEAKNKNIIPETEYRFNKDNKLSREDIAKIQSECIRKGITVEKYLELAKITQNVYYYYKRKYTIKDKKGSTHSIKSEENIITEAIKPDSTLKLKSTALLDKANSLLIERLKDKEQEVKELKEENYLLKKMILDAMMQGYKTK